MAHKYEIYKDRAGEYRARFKYNSDVILATEGYASKEAALNAIISLKRHAAAALVNDTTEGAGDPWARIARASVPAADRVVSLDHNSEVYRNFSSVLDDLEKGIRTSNELATMNSDALEAMKSEIKLLRTQVDQNEGRPAHIWVLAKSTLFWVADASASAVIGMLALAVLSALAPLLGIDL